MSLNITTQLKTFIEVLSDKERQKVETEFNRAKFMYKNLKDLTALKIMRDIKKDETEKAKSIFKNITIKKISQNSRLGEIMKEKDETKVHAEAVRFNKMVAEVYELLQKGGKKVEGHIKGKKTLGGK